MVFGNYDAKNLRTNQKIVTMRTNTPQLGGRFYPKEKNRCNTYTEKFQKLNFHHRLKPVESWHRELRTEILSLTDERFRLRLPAIHVKTTGR